MAKGAAAPRATLKYDAERYTPGHVQEWDDADLRKEYTRLRDIAQKRLKRIAQDKRARTSDIYKEFKGGFPKLRDITSKKELGQALADVSRFVRSKGSTVGGAKEIFKRRLQIAGIREEDVRNEYSIDEWMEIVRTQYGRELFDSDLAIQYYNNSAGINLTIEDYEKWLIGEDDYTMDPEDDSSSDDWDFDEI